MKILVSILLISGLASIATAKDYLGSTQTGTNYVAETEMRSALPYQPGLTDACPAGACSNKYGWSQELTNEAQSYKEILGSAGAAEQE